MGGCAVQCVHSMYSTVHTVLHIFRSFSGCFMGKFYEHFLGHFREFLAHFRAFLTTV